MRRASPNPLPQKSMIIVPANALVFVAGRKRMHILKKFDRFFAENKLSYPT